MQASTCSNHVSAEAALSWSLVSFTWCCHTACQHSSRPVLILGPSVDVDCQFSSVSLGIRKLAVSASADECRVATQLI